MGQCGLKETDSRKKKKKASKLSSPGGEYKSIKMCKNLIVEYGS